MPADIIVGGNLDLYASKIKTLPPNFTVGKNLILSDSEIKILPNNLTIGGSLFLNNTAIEELPENLTVGCSLILNNTAVLVPPTSLTVGMRLSLGDTKVIHSTHVKRYAPSYYTWQNNKYIKFSYLVNSYFNGWNDVFGELVESDGNMFFIRNITSGGDEFAILHDDGTWVHIY